MKYIIQIEVPTEVQYKKLQTLLKKQGLESITEGGRDNVEGSVSRRKLYPYVVLVPKNL